jgi:hypothetical protein
LFLAFVILSISNAYSGPSQIVNTTAEPQYLMFQNFTAGPEFTADAGKRGAEIVQLAEKCDNDSSEGYLERALRKPFAHERGIQIRYK